MLSGAHVIVYSTDADADRAFLRDVLQFPHVDVGDGWLIFGLPPSEVAIHPAEEDGSHELYLMCDDVNAFVADMKRRGVACNPPMDRGWGVLTKLTLPGGGGIGVYEPRHARPASPGAKKRKAPVTQASRPRTERVSAKPAKTARRPTKSAPPAKPTAKRKSATAKHAGAKGSSARRGAARSVRKR